MKKRITDRRLQTNTAAFTWPDLVVVLALLTLVSVLLFSGGTHASQKPGLVGCKNNLRQIGLAIDLYTRDNGNFLPGPVWSGVWAGYRKTGDPQAPTTWSLAYVLAPYLGIPLPDSIYREAEVMKCPASAPLVTFITNQIQNSGLCYMATLSVTNRAPGLEITNYPFGRPNPPMVMPLQITKIKRPSEQWAICDVDQKNLPGGAVYFNNLAREPVHNNRLGSPRPSAANRNYLFFDGNVQMRTTAQ